MTIHPGGRPGPAVVIGSGPGGLQAAYLLRRRGVPVTHLSADPEPGGMFRRLPLFDRLLSWTKPAPHPASPGRGPQWHDWNAFVTEPADRLSVADWMDGTSVFPTRAEMAAFLRAFGERTAPDIAYDTRWTGTRRLDGPVGGRLVVETSRGDLVTDALVVATGTPLPWRPPTPGIEHAADYSDLDSLESFDGSRVLVIGKQNSGFEVATALLPHAAQVIVVGPGPTRFTVTTHSFAGARARFDGAYEDHLVGGGTAVLDATIDMIRRSGPSLTVELTMDSTGRTEVVEVDHVITATGFSADLDPLAGLEPATVRRGRMPAQTPYWESTTAPGVFFAGTLTQSGPTLKRPGAVSTSASIQGFRYNAVVQAEHIARRIFGKAAEPAPVNDPGSLLVTALSTSSALMSQKGLLARVVDFDESGAAYDGGLVPLTAFMAGEGAAIAATLETGPDGIHPVLHRRVGAAVVEHRLDPDPFHVFCGPDHVVPTEEVVETLRRETRRRITA